MKVLLVSDMMSVVCALLSDHGVPHQAQMVETTHGQLEGKAPIFYLYPRPYWNFIRSGSDVEVKVIVL